jgi:hypothetical protein
MRAYYRSFDTLSKARGAFSFSSNKLDYIAQFLGVGEKYKHSGFSMWVECMKGNKEALEEMLYYCDKDVVVLEDVHRAIKNYTKQTTHVGAHNGELKHTCRSCGSTDVVLLKNNFTAAGTIKRHMECQTCKYDYEISNTAYKNFLTIGN